MPQNFNHKAPEIPSQKKPDPEPSIPQKDVGQKSETDTASETDVSSGKKTSVEAILTKGLNESDLNILSKIRAEIVVSDFIMNFMFNDQACISIKVNRHVSVSLRSPSSSEQEDLESYLYGKDPFGLFSEKDGAEIKAIMDTDSKLSLLEARDIFLRTFQRSTADNRYARAYLSAMMVKLNSKPLGRTIPQRYSEISKLPLYLFQQIYSYVGLFERAIKIELTDEEAVKN